MLRLENRNPPHNKYYEVGIRFSPETNAVLQAYGCYGAIGRNGSRVVLLNAHIEVENRWPDPKARTIQLVEACFSRIRSKIAGGYSPTNWEGPPFTSYPPMVNYERTENQAWIEDALTNLVNDPAVHQFLWHPLGGQRRDATTPIPATPAPAPVVEKKIDTITLDAIWAMNAQSVKDADHLEELLKDPTYALQLKIDGERAIVHIGHEGMRFFSRSPGVADPTMPKEKIIPAFDEITIPSLATSVIDCELVEKDGRPFLYVFDLLVLGGMSYMKYPQQDRWAMLSRYLPEFDAEYFEFLNVHLGEESKRNFLDNVVTAGLEGVMFKNLKAPYLQRARPVGTWYKQKKFATWDVVIMGFKDGNKGRSGQVGSVVYGQWKDGQLIEYGNVSGMKEEIRLSMTEDPDMWVGTVIKVGGMERLSSGAIRHPRFLGQVYDKQSKDCVYRENES